MKNYIADGDTVTITAAADTASGAGVIAGGLFGVALAAAATGTDQVLLTRGVFELTKLGGAAWAAGDLIYWDNAAKRCTKVSAAGLYLIGAAFEPALTAATLGKVRLNGIAVAAAP